MKSTYGIGFLIFLFCCKYSSSQNNDLSLINNTSKHQMDTLDVGKNLILKAKSHLGKPYLSKTLDTKIEESLTVVTHGFDCTTLVETVIAEVLSPENINAHIQSTRYRQGVINDYASRIHYFTEWIYENQKNGKVKDITSDFECSKKYDYHIDFMEKNRSKYMQLSSDSIFQKILKMEKMINNYTWNYIPKLNLNNCKQKIKDGDIIAITTNIKGLDISHLGFAHWYKNDLHLLHASTDEKKVVISSKSLSDYLKSNIKQTGIMVVRVLK
ncbi:MAG: hypothetical protein RLZZ546_2935 [Bacteroidota bacterium]|jgi:hypothetical protein